MSTEFIPKIVHQVWISKHPEDEPVTDNPIEKIPVKWRHCSQKYKDMCDANGWEYRVWTNDTARELISTEFSWFLEQYDKYEHVIQRADTIRYFLLYKFGGVYSDLDIAPKNNFLAFFDMYKAQDIVLASTCSKNAFGNQNFINGFMMSKPKSEFWPVVWKHLKNPGQSVWYKPMLMKTHYFKILFTTGPGIICDAAHEYDPDHTKITAIPSQLLQPQRTGQHKSVISTPESVVELVEGESWQQKDANIWRSIGEAANNTEWILLGFVIAFAFVILFLVLKLRSKNKELTQYLPKTEKTRKSRVTKIQW